MTGHFSIRTLLSFLTCWWVGSFSLAQTTPGESRNSSYFTYLYRLKDSQTERILKKGMYEIDASYLTQLAYTYPSDSLPPSNLNFGQYIQVKAIGNEIEYQFLTVANVVVKTLNNGSDLNLAVYDLDGNQVRDALVQLNRKSLKFDASTDGFRLKKNNKKGIVKVTYEGVTSYIGLSREIRYSKFRRSFNAVIYSVPLKYIAVPVKLVVTSPVDLYKSVRRRRPQGIFYYVQKPFADVVRSISWGDPQGFVRPLACIFDKYQCKDRDYEGFIAFNKPKYRPGDTVRIKAFVLNHKEKLVRKDLELSINSRSWYYESKAIQLGTLTPYQSGFYETSFILHDSLNLKLDQQYNLFLYRKDDYVMQSSFYHEDYELDKAEFTLRLSKDELLEGDSLELYLEGKDANGLAIKDASVEVAIKPAIVHELTQDSLYVHNTLWSTSKQLKPSGETTIEVPLEVFYDAELEYDVVANFSTADFEVHTKVKGFRYCLNKPQLKHTFEGDSLHLHLSVGDSSVSGKALVISHGEFYGRDSSELTLPAVLKVSPLVSHYQVMADEQSQTISLRNLSSDVEVFAERDRDSLHVQLANPRKLHVRYYLYKGNKEIRRGAGSHWKLDLKTTTQKEYFLSVQYVWAGRSYDRNYTLAMPKGQLNLTTNVPGTVYPGKNMEVQVSVTDSYGRPVKAVDLTSYGLKKSFTNHRPPSLPNFRDAPRNRRLINNFHTEGNGMDNSTLRKNLDWQKWNASMTLDSIEYYKFTYPKEGLYRRAFPAKNDLTQFAPYVVANGALEPVHIIYLDGVPIYFSMTEHEQFYSFRLKPGYHHLRLRTARYEIRLDSVYFEPDKKTIVSVDRLNRPSHRFDINSKPYELTMAEQRLAETYLAIIDNLDYNRYVQQEDRLFWTSKKQRRTLIGPLKPQVRGSYVVRKYYDQPFTHESGYRYKISKGLIKMTSMDDREYRFPYQINQELNDEVLTEAGIDRWIKEHDNRLQANYRYYSYPKESAEGRGAMAYWNPYPDELRIKNFLLFKENDPSFIRVYAGSQSTFHDLKPEEYHTFVLLYNDDYIEDRSLLLKSDATFYLRLDSARIQHSDSVSQAINALLKRGVKDIYYSETTQERNYSKIRSIYHSSRPGLELQGEPVSGRITDDTGEGLPGVTVLIKGTTSGTVTDLDGYYSLSVPPRAELVFSYVGFDTQETTVGSRSLIDVTMGGATELQEVVVTGFGVAESKQALGYSVATQTLQGKVAGVQITSRSGAPGTTKVQIRGSSSLTGNGQPLVIINGIPYQGNLDLTPDDIASMQVLKGDQATALYGSKAANGVVLIDLSNSAKARKFIESQALDLTAFPDISQANPLRRNFSDYAFWQPRAQTDEHGIATLNVTFPDDITTWKTHFLAIKGNKMSGSLEKEVRSFKPLMATLSVPRFLVETDTTYVLGRILNYTKDTVQLRTTFTHRYLKWENEVDVHSSHQDSLALTPAGTDTLEVQYSLLTAADYEDGELREIPVYRRGTLESKGIFKVLEGNETLTITQDSMQGAFTLGVKGNLLPVMLEEIKQVKNYAYGCNEQKASKLLALLYEKRILQAMSEEFEHDELIQKYIRQLLKAAGDNQQWGWWPNGKSVNWITRHVLLALYEARKEGYSVSYDSELVSNQLIAELQQLDQHDIKTLELLSLMNAPLDYPHYLEAMDTLRLNLDEQLRVIRLKQQAGMKDINLSVLWEHQQETMFGAMYWDTKKFRVYQNKTLTTLLVYQILSHEGGYQAEKQAIIHYLLTTRRTGYWRNTYESIKVLEAILPEVLENGGDPSSSRLIVSGDESQIIKEFPHESRMQSSNQIQFKNDGAGPLFLTAFQTTFNPAPEKVSKDFTVDTALDTLVLEKGKEVELRATITNAKDAEYVMVEVPIPAGTTYADKPRRKGREVHREYFRDRLAVFYQALPAGTYTIEVQLTPRYSGSYTLNPARAELMYFPTFYGREEMKRVIVR